MTYTFFSAPIQDGGSPTGHADSRIFASGRLPSAMLLAVFGAALGFSVPIRAQEEPRKPFFGMEHAALLEVRELKNKTEAVVGGIKVEAITLAVEVKGVLSPDTQVSEHRIVKIFHNKPTTFFHPAIVQDWFPVEVGKRIVIVFEGDDIPTDRGLEHAGASYESADENWKDCTSFYESVQRPADGRANALAKCLCDKNRRPGYVFFRLLQAYDRKLNDDPGLSTAFADYLRAREVPLRVKLHVTGLLYEEVGRSPESNREIVNALVEVARATGKDEQLLPMLGNHLEALSRFFVAGKKLGDLPKLTPEVRKELIALAAKNCPKENFSLQALMNWLNGVEPGDTLAKMPEYKEPRIAQEPVKPGPAPSAEDQPAPNKIGQGTQIVLYLIWALMAVSIMALLAIGFRAGRSGKT